jgi:Uma2 family endonuclease
MAQRAVQSSTFDELYRQIQELPRGTTGEILEPGVIRSMSRPGGPHRLTHRRILRSVRGSDIDEGGSGWWFEVEAEIRLPGDLLAVPDISAWRASERPGFVDVNPIEVLPDFCCEILSPSTVRDDRRLKVPIYARSGVGWTWLADPRAHLVEVYQTINGLPTLVLIAKDDEVMTLPPFEGEVDLGRWWLPAPARAT